MQFCITDSTCCSGGQLTVTQEQGESEPIVITYPYDITGVTFEGTIAFVPSLPLSLGSGIEIVDITSFTASILNNVLDVTGVTSGEIYLGMFINGLGVEPGAFITGFGTGTGGIGTYTVSVFQTIASTVMATSRISIQLTSSQTQNIPPSQYPFDLWSLGPIPSAIASLDVSGFFVINAALTRIS